MFHLVPSARLELAQLSPLPPQDSVSTNFTTTAAFVNLKRARHLAFPHSKTPTVYPEIHSDLSLIESGGKNYLAGI